jgi:transcriptional regulator with XRE-family HTH domain
MDVALLIRHRLRDLGLEQKDLAGAAQVTESYISQLLARKKAPPDPARTDIYEKIGQFLRLPSGELSRLAGEQRRLELRKKVAHPPRPLFRECRALILRKCDPGRRAEIERIFEKEAFGELERLVTQTALDVAQGIAREELRTEDWLRSVAEFGGRSFEEVRVAVLEFLDTDVFDISLEGCVSFLDPMIESWDIDLKTFSIEIRLNPRLAPGTLKRFEFVEVTPEPVGIEPGFEKFLNDATLSGNATEEEMSFLKTLRFGGRHPSALFYYRALQALRDPLHFTSAETPDWFEGRIRIREAGSQRASARHARLGDTGHSPEGG